MISLSFLATISYVISELSMVSSLSFFLLGPMESKAHTKSVNDVHPAIAADVLITMYAAEHDTQNAIFD